jgi:hypothetical protein
MEHQEDDIKTGRGEEGQRELFKSQIFMNNLQSTRRDVRSGQTLMVESRSSIVRSTIKCHRSLP